MIEELSRYSPELGTQRLDFSHFSCRFPFQCLRQGFARSNVLILALHNESNVLF